MWKFYVAGRFPTRRSSWRTSLRLRPSPTILDSHELKSPVKSGQSFRATRGKERVEGREWRCCHGLANVATCEMARLNVCCPRDGKRRHGDPPARSDRPLGVGKGGLFRILSRVKGGREFRWPMPASGCLLSVPRHAGLRTP